LEIFDFSDYFDQYNSLSIALYFMKINPKYEENRLKNIDIYHTRV